MKLDKLLVNSVILLSASILSSCMGAMMLGTDGHGSQAEGHFATEATLEKEVVVGELNATAVFPAIEIGKETAFTLRLSISRSGEPIRRAKVYSHVEFKHSAGTHQGMNHMAIMDTTSAMKDEDKHGIDSEQEVDDSSTPGTYSFSLKTHQSGIHTITFRVTEVDGQLLSHPLLIEAKRNVSAATGEHGGGMMGMGRSTTYVVIGATLMGAMMLTMWMARGSVF